MTTTLDHRLYMGDRAREVTENEAFIAAFEAIEQDLLETWKTSPATKNNVDARERIHMSLTLLGKVKATIQQTLETGKLAKLDLQYEQSLKDKAKALVGWN